MKIIVEMTDEEFVEYKKYKDDKDYFQKSLKNRFSSFIHSAYNLGTIPRDKCRIVEDSFDMFFRRYYEKDNDNK